MQRTRFDFDVITGPAAPRPAPKPLPKPKPNSGKSEPASQDEADK